MSTITSGIKNESYVTMHFDNDISKYNLGKHGYYYENNSIMVFCESWEHPEDVFQQKNRLVNLMMRSYETFLKFLPSEPYNSRISKTWLNPSAQVWLPTEPKNTSPSNKTIRQENEVQEHQRDDFYHKNGQVYAVNEAKENKIIPSRLSNNETVFNNNNYVKDINKVNFSGLHRTSKIEGSPTDEGNRRDIHNYNNRFNILSDVDDEDDVFLSEEDTVLLSEEEIIDSETYNDLNS